MKKSLGGLRQHTGFTLSEVLITLGIIGIVAAITIPVLINNIQDAQSKTAYKKAFSTASQAWIRANNDGKIVSRPNWTDQYSKETNFNAFKSYFNIIKDCNSNNNSDCWAAGDQYAGEYPKSSAFAFIDNSGMAWSLVSPSNGSELLVDTNGFKKPNEYGIDRFILIPVPITFNASDHNEYYNTDNYVGIPEKIVPEVEPTGVDVICPMWNTHHCYYHQWLYE